MSNVGGLLSTLKFLGFVFTSSFGESRLNYEIFNDLFQKQEKGSNVIDVTHSTQSKPKQIEIKETFDNSKVNNENNISLINERNMTSNNNKIYYVKDNLTVIKKTKINHWNLIFSCCYKKDKDKLNAIHNYFDKSFDIRNYFKRLIDIEKIKAILSYKSEKSKEFIFRKFTQKELEEMNFNSYEKELLLKFYHNTGSDIE